MIKKETAKILGILTVAYPRFDNFKGDKLELAVDLWTILLNDAPYNVVEIAVKKLILESPFPPVIADVRKKIAELTRHETITEMEAWAIVSNAIQGAIYNSTENFNKLPPLIQKLVGSPNQLRDWAIMDIESVQSVVQSNFMRSFKARQAKEEQNALLPETMRQMINGIAEQKKIGG